MEEGVAKASPEQVCRFERDSLKRIMVERCLPEDVTERVQYKRTLEDIWKYLDMAYNRPDVFLHDLMAPVKAARTISEGD